MLATLVIALREGLEAVLIVSIIATFLRKNQQPLAPMWWGVAAAVILSVIVGAVLSITEHALPQAQQEAMETVIGFIAVIFVSSMILWMQQHAPQLRQQLEQEANIALHRSSRWAMPLMAFLAVLKEGFETSVFLLATFSAVGSAWWAALGAIVGLLLALLIGWGIYRGGIHLNLARFFRITGLFLIFVAAGLVISALRSAHEAGWILIGQEKIVNLYWLIPPGSLRAALISGVLGIPADPRLIEVAGWAIYLALFAIILSWPKHRLPSPNVAKRLYYGVAGLAFVMVFGCQTLLPEVHLRLPQQMPLVSAEHPQGPAIGTLTRIAPNQLQLSLSGQPPQRFSLTTDNAATQQFSVAVQWTQAPSQLSLDEVVALYHHNRVPPGLSPQQHPGPYQAAWRLQCQITLTAQYSQFIAANAEPRSYVSLSGSGLQAPRLINVKLPTEVTLCPWQNSHAWQQQVDGALQHYHTSKNRIDFLRGFGSSALLVIGLCSLILGLRKKSFSK